MDVQTIQNILKQQKQVIVFLVNIQCQQLGHLITQKTNTFYRGKDCMKKFCESLREHSKNINYFEKKKLLSLTKEELKSHEDAKVCYLWQKNLEQYR